MTAEVPTPRRRALLLLGAGAALCSLALAGCSSEPAVPDPSSTPMPEPTSEPNVVFSMNFDGQKLLGVEPAQAAKVKEETFFGGMLTVVPSHRGAGTAIQFPAFSEVLEEPGVGLVATSSQDTLPNPGTSTFGFGADVRFDEVGAKSEADNGDNVIQRGLASDPSQFKLQVDSGVPSCTVTGSEGRLIVKGESLEPGVWYTLSCFITDDGLEITVKDIAGDTSSDFVIAGSVGAVEFPADVPIAIGRKVGAGGVGIKKQPDQYNGAMDTVWVSIDAPA